MIYKRDKLQPRIEAKSINSIYFVLSVRKYLSSSVLVKTTKMRHLMVALKDKDEGKEAFIGFTFAFWSVRVEFMS